MIVSDEQMGAVMHGLGGKPWWKPAELPTGVWSPPKWLVGAHVNMMEDCANPPQVMFKTRGDPWPDDVPKLFELEGEGAWTARSPDGYMMIRHWHTGAVHKMVAWRMMNGDEIVTKSNPGGWLIEPNETLATAAATKHLELCKKLKTKGDEPKNYRFELKEMWATTKDNGYGGRHFEIKLKDGRDLVLRGPWHGGSGVGWHDVHWFDIAKWEKQEGPRLLLREMRTMRPWYSRGGTFGIFFADELVMRAVARWQPHVAVAMVYPGYGHARHEFYDPAWGAPKAFAQERKMGWGPKT